MLDEICSEIITANHDFFLRIKSKQTEKTTQIPSALPNVSLDHKLKIMNAFSYFSTNLQESIASTSSLCVTGIHVAQAYYKHHI